MAGKSRPQEEVIKDFIEVHGNKYDYSKVTYTGASKNIIIICPIHGDFKLMAGKHKLGRGCKDCRKIKEKEERLSKAKQCVIAKFREVHGDFYNYDKVVYNRNDEKVIITCPVHGDFPQAPAGHKRGEKCPDCSYEKRSSVKIEKTKTTLIEDFKKAHGDYYNYDKVEYVKGISSVIITCPIHGDFPQTPNSHKAGKGCSKCKVFKAKETFIKKANKNLIFDFNRIHNNFYSYDNVVYEKSSLRVIITCPIHGDFPQTPNRHKLGKGCPDCGRENNTPTWSHTEWQKAGEKSKNFDSFKVYILRCWNDEEEFYKIGKTFKKVKDRFNSKYHMPYNYETILEETFENAKEASIREDDLKAKNRENKYLPSINFNGKQECFSKNPCTD